MAAVARRRPVVLVHGGGKRITEWLERLGVPSQFEGGLRVTDQAALEVAAAVLRGVVNSELVAGLRDLGVDAVGLSGVDGGLLVSRAGAGHGARRPASSGCAAICSTRSSSAARCRSWRRSPATRTGIVCNVNADDAAAGIAAGLGARQLVLLTDVDGVRDADGRRLDTLTSGEAEGLIASGVIAGGMVPKIRAALAALAWEGIRGDHRRRVGRSRPRAGARRPDIRDPDHGQPIGSRGCAAAGDGSGDLLEPRRDHDAPRSSSATASGRSASSVAATGIGSQQELVDG